MGIRSNRPLGDAYEGRSEFADEDNLASLEEAFEEAAKAAAADLGKDMLQRDDDDLEFDVRIVISARTDNQHVKTYTVIITPGS
jgi:hypothetical protein